MYVYCVGDVLNKVNDFRQKILSKDLPLRTQQILKKHNMYKITIYNEIISILITFKLKNTAGQK